MRYSAGNGHDEFAEPHDDGVRRAGEIAGNAADDHAERERQQDADDADGQRNLRAVKQPRKNIAPELVGAEQENRIIFVAGAEQMDGGRNQAEQFVFVAANKKMERLRVIRNDAINENAGALLIARHDEMESLQFRPDRRMKRIVGVQAVVTVGRDETGEQRHEVKENQNDAAGHGDLPPLQPLPEQLPRRKRLLSLRRLKWARRFPFIFWSAATCRRLS